MPMLRGDCIPSGEEGEDRYGAALTNVAERTPGSLVKKKPQSYGYSGRGGRVRTMHKCE